MAGVRDRMRRIDARIYRSWIVKAVATIGTAEISGAFFSKAREITMPGGNVMGIGISFECQYDAAIGQLELNELISIDDYGSFRFLRELIPGGDESGKTVIELGESLA